MPSTKISIFYAFIKMFNLLGTFFLKLPLDSVGALGVPDILLWSQDKSSNYALQCISHSVSVVCVSKVIVSVEHDGI